MGRWLEAVSAVTAPGAERKTAESQAWVEYARTTAAALLAEDTGPPAIAVYGPVLYPDEDAFFEGSADYARLYGGDGTYESSSLLALGSVPFMVGAFAANGVLNQRRKAKARREAAVVWREQQRVGLVGTTHRLLINTAQQGWMSFDYSAVSEFYPDFQSPQNPSLTMGFGNIAPPMRLSGPPVAAAAVLVAAATSPGRWAQDPRLRPILG